MSLPKKNFNQVNRRIESLNELIYVTITYDYEFGDLTNKTDEERLNIKQNINGTKDFTCMDETMVKTKVVNWLDSLVRLNILKHYNLKDIQTKDLEGKLTELNLKPILEI